MSNLIACMIAYNEEVLLPGAIESIINKVDRMVIVEGRISNYPGDGIHSTDKTQQIIQDYGCHMVTIDRPWIDEQEIRTAYLAGDEGDIYYLMDADERYMTPLPTSDQLPHDAYAVRVKMIGDSTFCIRPRIFRHHGDMRFRGVHDALFSDDELVSNPNKVPLLHSVWIAHYQMFQRKGRRMEKDRYYKNSYTHEPAIRHELGMVYVKKQ